MTNREPSWRDLGRSAADLLRSLEIDLRGCSAGTDSQAGTKAKRTTGESIPWPGTPGKRWF
jgi:hypothetical protein